MKVDKNIEKAIDISEILIKQGAGEVTDSEELKQFIRKNKKASSSLINKLRDEKRGEEITNFLLTRGEAKDVAIAKLLNSLNSVKRRRERNLRIAILSTISAAAVIAISFLITKSSNELMPKEIAATQIVEPIIITDQGGEIALSNFEDSTLKRDVKSVKVSDLRKIKAESKGVNEVIIPKMKSYKLILPDNSEVVLNANSRLKYPSNFGENNRSIELEGEGYFNVTKSDIPFIVKSSKGEVRVYGTIFNIENYPNKEFRSVLVEGSVGVTLPHNDGVVMLKPNEMLISDAGGKYRVEEVDANNYTLWTKSEFEFIDTELSIVVEVFEKWYGVDIKIESEELKKLPITALLRKSSSIDDSLNFIGELNRINFIKESANEYIVE